MCNSWDAIACWVHRKRIGIRIQCKHPSRHMDNKYIPRRRGSNTGTLYAKATNSCSYSWVHTLIVIHSGLKKWDSFYVYFLKQWIKYQMVRLDLMIEISLLLQKVNPITQMLGLDENCRWITDWKNLFLIPPVHDCRCIHNIRMNMYE